MKNEQLTWKDAKKLVIEMITGLAITASKNPVDQHSVSAALYMIGAYDTLLTAMDKMEKGEVDG